MVVSIFRNATARGNLGKIIQKDFWKALFLYSIVTFVAGVFYWFWLVRIRNGGAFLWREEFNWYEDLGVLFEWKMVEFYFALWVALHIEFLPFSITAFLAIWAGFAIHLARKEIVND